MKASFNIAILGKDFIWGGGVELLRTLANAFLSTKNEQRLKVFLLLPVQNKEDFFVSAKRLAEKIISVAINERSPYTCQKKLLYDPLFLDFSENVDGPVEIVTYYKETGYIDALQRINADVVLPAISSLGTGFPISWLGYIFDFQHKYYPDYFTAKECLDRDIRFATMLRDSKAIIVNAKSVENDIDKFFPYHNCKVFELPFSAAAVSNWLDEIDPARLLKYHLPPRYFIISNQFWIHKSHITAFQALSQLAKAKVFSDIHIVCTGKMEDNRFPEHIKNIQRQLDTLGIRDRVHFLGHIPKIDQIAIMKNSLAVLQPTLFEGGPGGGSVYDAVSLGVPAIISDIPINLEIKNEDNIFYFNAGSPDSLAEKINFFLEMNIVRPSRELLILRGEERKHLLCEVLLQAIECAL